MALNLSTELSSYGYSDKDIHDLLTEVGFTPPDVETDEWLDWSNEFLGYPEQYMTADKLTKSSSLPAGVYSFGWDHNGAFGLMFYADTDDVNEIREQEGCEPIAESDRSY